MSSIYLKNEEANRHFNDEHINLELEFVPVDDDDVVIRHDVESNAIAVGYLVHDGDLEWDGWEINPDENSDVGEEGVFVEFNSEDSRERFKLRMENEGRTALVVDRYKHSGVDYSVSNTKPYPDRQWDVVPNGVFVPCDDVQEQFNRGDINYEQLIESANASLQVFSDFCNGYGYGAVMETFVQNDAGEWTQESIDDVWGMIGSDHAKGVLEDNFMDGYPEFKKAPAYESGPGLG